MSEFATVCPHCRENLDVPDENNGKLMKCPFCNKRVVPRKTQPKVSNTFSKLMPTQPIPDDYHTAIFYVTLLKVVGLILVILGIVTGVITASSVPEFVGDGSRILGFFVNVIGGILLALPCFVSAVFLNLFCGMAKNTAYLVALNEKVCESQNREG